MIFQNWNRSRRTRQAEDVWHDRGAREEDFRGIGPSNYQRTDENIYEDVNNRLTQHGLIDARQIVVEVKNSEVTLRGMVNSRQARRMAEDVAEDVTGVRDVHNELKVQQYDRRNQSIRNSGVPGGGQGRIDRVGKSGVYPASGPWPEGDAPVQGEASWGQGVRGEQGYEDHGESETHYP